MGHGADVWASLSGMLESGDLDGMPEIYDIDAKYYEPYNPPHNGNLLIQAYIKDYLAGKDKIAIEEKFVIESADNSSVAIEWTISYDAGGRRWNDLPRATFIAFGDDGQITYQRDYS